MNELVLGAETGHLLADKVCSVIRYDVRGSSKQHTMFYQRNLTICYLVTSESGTTLTYLVK